MVRRYEQVYAWEEADKEILAKLLSEGRSSAQIANEMPTRGGVRPTRNAVIGKINRWGLKGNRPKMGLTASRLRPAFKPSVSLPKVAKEPKPKPAASYPTPPATAPTPEPPPAIIFAEPKPMEFELAPATSDELRPGGVAVLALKHHECKWPIGDPRLPGFHFCCAPRVEGEPYCQHHLYERAAEPGTRVGWWKPGRRR